MLFRVGEKHGQFVGFLDFDSCVFLGVLALCPVDASTWALSQVGIPTVDTRFNERSCCMSSVDRRCDLFGSSGKHTVVLEIIAEFD